MFNCNLSKGLFMRVMRHLFLYLLLLLASGCGPDVVKLRPLPQDGIILAFGDSLTAGYGAAREQSYPAVLAQFSGLRVINAGVSGELSAAGRDRLPALLADLQPQLVILCHGGNDLLRRTGDAAAKANLLAMIEQVRQTGAEVVLLGVPEPGIFLNPAAFYAELAEEARVAYIPELLAEVLGDPALKSDPAHPNAAGYQIMAQGIFDFLIDAGAY